ncbi:MAG: DUF4129 domain-containing protein [Actinobacteria bacterium]|nr:DUF4129 domain-containing protein [Actinomycetota bacterium]
MPSRPGPHWSSGSRPAWWLAGVALLLTVLVASAAGVFRHFEPADIDRGDALRRAAIGAVIGGVVASGVFLGLRRRDRAPDRETLKGLAMVLVSLFAIAAVTTSPRSAPQTDDVTPPATTVLLPSNPTTDTGPPADRPADDTTGSSEDVGSGLMGVIIGFGLAAIVAIMLTYRRTRDDRRGRLAPWGSAPMLPEPAPMDEEAAAQTFADTARLLLDDDDPRRAVIAAYAALLDGLADAGAPRAPYEAPEEHLHRALDALDIPADASAVVTDLFLLARFSEHPVTDTERRRAVAALQAAERALRERSVRA